MCKVVDTVILSLSVTLLFILFGTLSCAQEPVAYTGVSARELYVELPKLQTPNPTSTPAPKLKPLDLDKIDEFIVTDYRLELEYLGVYYITAYSPLETGSWYTATDTYCHSAEYEDRYTEPTTCAIDPRLHDFGDTFYIPELDRCYVAEDTGGAVKGQHIDVCFTDDTLDSVYYFPTGYYEVYAVEVIEYQRLDIE